jgi:hypothetical protein
MITTGGIPQRSAAEELRLECMFPADKMTEEEHVRFVVSNSRDLSMLSHRASDSSHTSAYLARIVSSLARTDWRQQLRHSGAKRTLCVQVAYSIEEDHSEKPIGRTHLSPFRVGRKCDAGTWPNRGRIGPDQLGRRQASPRSSLASTQTRTPRRALVHWLARLPTKPSDIGLSG